MSKQNKKLKKGNNRKRAQRSSYEDLHGALEVQQIA
jgi:hypothetical protein